MQIITLYRYERDGGGITVSPVKPDKPYTTLYRVVADEGKVITDGSVIATCIDTETPYIWDEIDAPENLEELT